MEVVKWEYRIEEIFRPNYRGEKMEALLNDLGALGWELFRIEPTIKYRCELWFKRFGPDA